MKYPAFSRGVFCCKKSSIIDRIKERANADIGKKGKRECFFLIELRKYGEKSKSTRPAAIVADESQIGEVCPDHAALILARLKRSNVNKLDRVEDFCVVTLTYPAFFEAGPLRLGVLTDFGKTAYLLTAEDEEIPALAEAAESATNLYDYFFSLLLRFSEGDSERLEGLEKKISDLEDTLVQDPERRNAAKEIIGYRKLLLKLKQHYESMTELLEAFEPPCCQLERGERLSFEMLTKRLSRLLSQVLALRDYITQVREAYQAQVDIQQNRLMKTFTVIAAIFMPLQLITGWYGMNLIMPETAVRWAYPVLGGVCAVIVVVCVWIFHRRKWI